jgi:exodeoxyribonuclease VII large subunit
MSIFNSLGTRIDPVAEDVPTRKRKPPAALLGVKTSHPATSQKDIETFARIVVGLGPQSTLQRGFAIARDEQDAPLTSREAALKRASFRVEFRDGTVAVDNREYEKGDR